MSNLQENPVWVDAIYQVTDETPVLGKVDGVPGEGPSNLQAQQLACRTLFLKNQMESIPDYREYTFFITAEDPDGTNAGIAGTPAGQLFRVAIQDSGNDIALFIYYKNNGGTAEFFNIELSKNYFDAKFSAINKTIQKISSAMMYRDGIPGFSLPVLSKNGRVVGFTESGGIFATHVEMPGIDAIPLRDAPFMFPVVFSKISGKVMIGIDPETGKTFLQPDDTTMAFIRSRMGDISGGYLPPSTIRGGYEVSGVREKDEFYYATVQERFNSKSFDVKQKINGTVATLVPDRIAPIEVRGLMSQSNGVLAGDTPVRETRTLFPFSALSFRERNFAQGGSGEIDPGSLTEFTPLADAASQTNNNLPATMTAFAHEYLKKEMGGDVSGQIVFTAGQGSVAMSALLPESVNWKNYFSFMSAAKRIAATYGRDVIQHYVTIIQGENGTNYASDFTIWADSITSEIKRVTGQSADCKIVLWQITGGGNGYENGVGTLQLNFLDTRADILMPGPMYGYPTAADRTHLNAYGRMMMGECQAYMELMISNGMVWRPFRMTSAIRTGKVITIETELPPGTVAAARDYNWMPSVPQDGFVYANNGDGTVALSSVAYSGSKIVLTLASEPTSTAGERISYGLNNSAGEGWAWFGGMAMAETSIRSPFNLLGHPVPPFIRLYLLRERIGVTL